MHKFTFYIGDAESLLARRVTAGIPYVFYGYAMQSGMAGRVEMVRDIYLNVDEILNVWVNGSPAQGLAFDPGYR